MRNMKHDSKHFLSLELLLLPNDRRLGFVSSMEVGKPCPYLGIFAKGKTTAQLLM